MAHFIFRLLGLLVGFGVLVGVVGAQTVAAAGHTPTVVQSAKVTASDGIANAGFGWSVAMDGHTLVVGTPSQSVEGHQRQGEVYIYDLTQTGDRTEIARLVASDGAVQDFFGYSVAIKGNTIVVGASKRFTQIPGAAYVFSKPAGGWAGTIHESAILTAKDQVKGNRFGASVAIDGNTIVVGAPHQQINGRFLGAVDVFVKPTGGWVGHLQNTAQLLAGDEPKPAGFGEKVAIQDKVIAVSGSSSLRYVSIFVRPISGWTGHPKETAKLESTLGFNAELSLALSRYTIFLGPMTWATKKNIRTGSVLAYQEPSFGWRGSFSAEGRLDPQHSADEQDVGISLATNGEMVLAGAAPKYTSTPSAGYAYLYAKPARGWTGNITAPVKVVPNESEPGDRFGGAVAIKGHTLAISASDKQVGQNIGQGVVYIMTVQQ